MPSANISFGQIFHCRRWEFTLIAWEIPVDGGSTEANSIEHIGVNLVFRVKVRGFRRGAEGGELGNRLGKDNYVIYMPLEFGFKPSPAGY